MKLYKYKLQFLEKQCVAYTNETVFQKFWNNNFVR